MPLVSYAQNFEDVILYRALKSIDKGFYVDVGAMDPVEDSVTKAFYDMGWHGINIEPLENNYQKFLETRPLDININCLAGDYSGETNFYEIVNTGLSTQDKDKAEEFSRNNGYDLVEHVHTIDTLTNILDKVNPPIIHFLKIDVEGAEESVLNGTDLKRFRPWIILVESTVPGTPIQDYGSWEPYLLSHSYDFAYFDGINRFYVAHEKENLIQEVNLPPNVFDHFITFREISNKGEINHILQLTDNLNRAVTEGFGLQRIFVEKNSRLEEENSNLRLNIDSLSEKLEHASEIYRQLNFKLVESESKIKSTEQLYIEISKEKDALVIENQKLNALEGKIRLLEDEKRVLESNLQESLNNKQALLDELMSLYSSKFFRLTRPLRSFARRLRKLAGKCLVFTTHK